MAIAAQPEWRENVKLVLLMASDDGVDFKESFCKGVYQQFKDAMTQYGLRKQVTAEMFQQMTGKISKELFGTDYDPNELKNWQDSISEEAARRERASQIDEEIFGHWNTMYLQMTKRLWILRKRTQCP